MLFFFNQERFIFLTRSSFYEICSGLIQRSILCIRWFASAQNFQCLFFLMVALFLGLLTLFLQFALVLYHPSILTEPNVIFNQCNSEYPENIGERQNKPSNVLVSIFFFGCLSFNHRPWSGQCFAFCNFAILHIYCSFVVCEKSWFSRIRNIYVNSMRTSRNRSQNERYFERNKFCFSIARLKLDISISLSLFSLLFLLQTTFSLTLQINVNCVLTFLIFRFFSPASLSGYSSV